MILNYMCFSIKFITFFFSFQFANKNETISVNKQLLRQGIPYFNAMFSNHFQEARQSEINLGIGVEHMAASKLINLISKGSLKGFHLTNSTEYLKTDICITN